MRNRLSLFLLAMLILPVTSFAQRTPGTGIAFFTGNWKSLLNEAGKQHKLIFVDVYTDWCAPCKRMEKEVFPLAEVGKVYNEFFVNYRLNAERGEGITLADNYAVKSYPAYLFLDSGGTLVYRTGDYMKSADFIYAARKAKAKKDETGSLASLEAKFRQGNRQPAFLRTLLEKRTSLKMDNAEVINAYVSVLSPQQLHTAETLHFLSKHMGSTVSNAVPLLLEGIKQLYADDQQKMADKLYSGLLYYALGTAIKEKKVTDAGKLLADVEKIRPFLSQKNQPSVENLALHYYQLAKDTTGLKKIGYQMATKQMAISTDSIRKKDKILFEQVMQPFWSGKEDSTKIPDFNEEKKLVAMQYSANVATTLYTIANAFRLTLPPRDKALNDALIWARSAYLLYQNEAILKLRSELEQSVRNY
jgi:thioredoxin-related protein